MPLVAHIAKSEAVEVLFDQALQRFGQVSTMIERDDRIPPLPVLLDELEQVLRADPPLARMIAPIVAGRLNMTDRL